MQLAIFLAVSYSQSPTSCNRCSYGHPPHYLVTHAGFFSLLLVRIACPPSFSLSYFSYALLVRHPTRWLTSHTHCLSTLHLHGYISYVLLVHFPSRWPTSPTRCSFVLNFADIHSDLWQGLLRDRVACLLSSSLATSPTHYSFLLIFANIHSDLWQYLLLKRIVCPLSSLLAPCPMHCSSSFLLLASLPLLRIATLSSLSLTYITTCGSAYFSTLLLVCSPRWLLLHVASLLSFSLAYLIYALLVRFPSHWPISPTCCLFVLTFANIHYDLWQGLLLECVACLLSSLLAPSPTRCLSTLLLPDYISYTLLVCFPSHWPTSPTRCLFVLTFAGIHSDLWQGLLLERIACPLSSLATSPTNCSFLIILADIPSDLWQGLLLESITYLLSSLAYFSYTLLVCSPRWPTRYLSGVIFVAGILSVSVAHVRSFPSLACCCCPVLHDEIWAVRLRVIIYI